MNVRVVFFDLGDTLVQIAPDILEDSTRRIAVFTGHPVSVAELKQAERAEWQARSPRDFLWIQTEEQERIFWEEDFYPSVLKRLGISDYPPQLVQLLAARAMDPCSFVPFLEVPGVLEELKGAGIELGMISNSFPSAERIIRHLNLERYFKYIIFSHQVGAAKPDPEIYRTALRSANIRPDEALFVDDRGPLVQGAIEVGIPSLFINRNGCSNGWKGGQIRHLHEILIFQFPLRAGETLCFIPGQSDGLAGNWAVSPSRANDHHNSGFIKEHKLRWEATGKTSKFSLHRPVMFFRNGKRPIRLSRKLIVLLGSYACHST